MNKRGIFLETALNRTFVSLYEDDKILHTKYSLLDFKSDNTYVYDISLMLEECSIKLPSINEVIVVNGPGYFTGIRAGIMITKALFYVFNFKVLIIDSFSFLRGCLNWKDDCVIIISASKRDCFISYFKEFNRVKDAIFPIEELSKLNKDFKLFTESPLISSTYSIELVEPGPVLGFRFDFARTVDEIAPFYMRSEENLFHSKIR